MARYIDADELLENTMTWLDGTNLVMDVSAIDKQPTADVEKVVRCADCIYFSHYKNTPYGWCHCKHVDRVRGYSDFCSYGI